MYLADARKNNRVGCKTDSLELSERWKCMIHDAGSERDMNNTKGFILYQKSNST